MFFGKSHLQEYMALSTGTVAAGVYLHHTSHRAVKKEVRLHDRDSTIYW